MTDDNELSESLDLFVESMDLLAVQLVELVNPSGNTEDITASDPEKFLSSIFTASKYNFQMVNSQINQTQFIIRQAKRMVAGKLPLDVKSHENRVKELNKNTNFVRTVCATVQPAPNTQPSEEETHNFNETMKLVYAYRSLLQQFNEVINEYNKSREPSQPELIAKASLDISPN